MAETGEGGVRRNLPDALAPNIHAKIPGLRMGVDGNGDPIVEAVPDATIELRFLNNYLHTEKMYGNAKTAYDQVMQTYIVRPERLQELIDNHGWDAQHPTRFRRMKIILGANEVDEVYHDELKTVRAAMDSMGGKPALFPEGRLLRQETFNYFFTVEDTTL